jgi:broad-specificity NMP kinase
MKLKNSKPFCILFAGPPGCSKTPVAYYLSWNLNLPIFNNDAIRTEVHEDTLSLKSDNDLQLKIRNERLEKLMRSKINFICDASIDRAWPKFKPKLQRAGYSTFIISFNLSSDFLIRLAKAKEYTASKTKTNKWFTCHNDFLNQYSKEIDFVINNDNFTSRLEESLKAVKRFINN